MTSETELMERVRDVVRRASLLEESQGEFDVKRFLISVREALAVHELDAAETMVAGAEASLDSLEARLSSGPPRTTKGVQSRFAYVRQRVLGAIRNHPFGADLCALAVVAVVWAGVLVWIQYQSYLSFQVLNDISVFNQALYTASHSHAVLYYSRDLPGGNRGQFLSVHFSPFLYALVPIYYLFPGIPTLLVVKQLALALGALPAYALARAKLGTRAWGWLVAGVYLTTPLITGIDWANFDMESMLPLALLTAFYFFEVRSLRWFIVSAAVALSLIESVAPLLALFAAIVFVGSLFPLSKRGLPANRVVRKFATWALVASAASFALSYVALTWVFRSPGGGSLGSAFSGSFSTLGASSIPDIPLRVVLHPGDAIAAVSFDGNMKVLYVLLLFGCLAFLPLFGDLKYLLPALAWIFGVALLSNASLYFVFSSHMLAYVAPFLIVGAITGIRRVLTSGPRVVERIGLATKSSVRWRRRWNPYALASILAVGLLVTVAVASPWNAQPLAVPAGYPSGLEAPTPQDTALSRVLSYLPSSASVLTTNVVFTAVSARKAAFLEPGAGVPFLLNWTNDNPSGGGALAFHRVTEWYLNMSQYVVLDFQLDPMTTLAVLYFGNNLTGYGVLAADDGAVLYERGWSAPPVLWIPEQVTLTARQSATNASVYTTKTYHDLPVGEFAATFWWGDNESVGTGTLRVTVRNVPVVVEATLNYETATGAKYTLGLNLTSRPASTNTSSLPATGSVQFQLGFPESVSFSVTETQPVRPVLLAVVITQEMP